MVPLPYALQEASKKAERRMSTVGRVTVDSSNAYATMAAPAAKKGFTAARMEAVRVTLLRCTSVRRAVLSR